MKKTLAGLLCIGLLAGCGQQVENSTPLQHKEVKTVTPSPPPPPQESQKDIDKRDLGQYANQSLPILSKIKKNLADINTLSSMAGNDPSISITSSYQNDVNLVCNNLMTNVYAMNAIDNPDNNQQVADLSGIMGDAMNDLQFVAINFPIAVQQENPDLINACAQHIANFNIQIENVTSTVEEDNKQNGVE